METTALLVKQSDLQNYLTELMSKEQGIVDDLLVILPYLKNDTLKTSIQKRLSQGLECLAVLKAGFVPVEGGYFTKVDTKKKWQRKWVQETLESMPAEVKEVWNKVKKMGVFDTFAVSTGGGDPMLVGRKGRKNFFIAGWLPLDRKISLGIRMRLP